MDIQTCIAKLGYVGVLSFATVDEYGAPQVRQVSAIHYEGTSLYFLTARGKPFAKQLLRDGRVQILAYTKYKEMIRLSGRVHLAPEDEQIKWRNTIYQEQPYLENVYPGESKNIDCIFALTDYTIEYFCLSTNPITREYFTVGNVSPLVKGYEITDACIGCGTCVKYCPQRAIEAYTTPFVIRQENCLQCGNCFEHCPVKAVKARGN